MKFILSALLLSGLFSCDNDYKYRNSPKGPVNEESYIQGFFELNDIHVTPASGVKVDKANRIISLNTSFDPPKVYNISDGIGIFIAIGSEGIEKGLIDWKNGGEYTHYYLELVNKIGDTSYNSKIMHGLSYDGRIIANADTLSSINITCDEQIDNNHPKGVSLNDLFSVYFEDPCAIIKNGYKSVEGLNYYSLDGMAGNFPYSLFGSKLSLVDFVKKPHIGTKLFFILDNAPDKTGAYNFTVSVANKQGKVIEKKSNPIYIKGLE